MVKKREERKRAYFVIDLLVYPLDKSKSYPDISLAPWRSYVTLSILIIIIQKTYISSVYGHQTLFRFDNIQNQHLESRQSFIGFGCCCYYLVYSWQKVIHHTLCQDNVAIITNPLITCSTQALSCVNSPNPQNNPVG